MGENGSALKPALLGLAGGSIEWYDFLLYGTAAALVFPTVFFPASMPPFAALIASFSTFGVGFVARPFGAVLFGHMGDKVGRKATLAAALILMGTATTLIAFLPSYQTAGVFAPLALVVLRLAQGLAVGGQWGGAMLLAIENAPRAQRGLYGSIAQVGVNVGVMLANIAVLAASGATTPAHFMSFGWRIPFLLSILLVGLGLYLYFRVAETRVFRQAAALAAASRAPRRASPIIEALRVYRGRILLAAGVFVPINAMFYIIVTYAIAYGAGPQGLHLPRSTLLGAVLISQLVATPVGMLSGALSDRWGRRTMTLAGVALAGLWAFAVFPLMDTRSFLWITVALTVAASFNNVTYGPMAALFAEQFDTRLRYSAMSLSYQIGAILGGGFGPIIATGLYARYHTNVWVAVCLATACVLSLVCIVILTESNAETG